jgi:cell division protein FtsQ
LAVLHDLARAVAKTDGQSGRISTRIFSKGSAKGGVLAEDGGPPDVSHGEDNFYRPPTVKASSDRPLRRDSVFREKRSEVPSEDDEDEPFLRSSRRVAVRQSLFPRSLWGRIGFAAGAIVVAGGLAWLGVEVRSFAAHDPRFRIDSSDNIQILGNSEVTQAELLSVFGGDMGRNVFFVPLSERRGDLERLPWVETATVMRLLPDQLRVAVVERTPVAFVRNGNEIGLVDREGILLPMDPKTLAARHYSFPVVTGIAPSDAASTRAARMTIYQRFIAELDSGSDKISSQLSEVDLSDPEDVRALVPSEGSDLLLHLGDQDFLARWRNYQQHLAEWKAQYPRLASVDLRYERQVVLEMQKGASIAPAQEPGLKTMDDLKAEVGAVSPTASKHTVAAGRKAAPTKSAAYAGKRFANGAEPKP